MRPNVFQRGVAMKHLFRIATFALGAILGASAVFVYQRWSAWQIHFPSGSSPQIKQQAMPSRANAIGEITLYRATGMMGDVGYTVVLRRDGTAIYESENARRAMNHRGWLSPHHFDLLANFLESQGYFNLEDRYSAPVTDADTIVTSAVRNGERKTVRHYAGVGPRELKLIELMIDGAISQTVWPEENGMIRRRQMFTE
jgi:hypothetical protein